MALSHFFDQSHFPVTPCREFKYDENKAEKRALKTKQMLESQYRVKTLLVSE